MSPTFEPGAKHQKVLREWLQIRFRDGMNPSDAGSVEYRLIVNGTRDAATNGLLAYLTETSPDVGEAVLWALTVWISQRLTIWNKAAEF